MRVYFVSWLEEGWVREGEQGDDYVRIALVENEQRIRQAARNIRRFFETSDRTLHNVVPLTKAG